MKDRILAFLVSKMGGVITPVIAVVVGSIVAQLAMVDPKLAESVDQVSLTGFFGGSHPFLGQLLHQQGQRQRDQEDPSLGQYRC